MKIIIQCSVCGNKVEIDKKPKSVVDLKKILNEHKFSIDETTIENNALKSIIIQCKNCNKDHIELTF
ncbi:hypothetical protein [Eubacterium limosum]|uniref:hypothetical protein n=1 Tax=Eubacterium limosum TaxID=1736 RepID=UPI0022E832FB|nr:hypothetical protein [Eubacterium limosum]